MAPNGEAPDPRILDSIKSRRARRAISDEPILRETAELLLQAAHMAPSCANNQPWRFVTIDDSGVLDRVKDHLTTGNYWAKPSPLIIAVVSRADLDCQIPDGREYYAFCCGMATMNLMLQATDLGLVSHPIAGFKQAPIKDVLGIPADYTLITLIILGHPADNADALSEKHRGEETSERSRRPLDEVISWNRFAFDDRVSQ
ncbi:nitroreductase family protein [Candidatus Bipolaricaulota bacterium]|nr:nitroreductase family protein [Candidatus Bipolaricaulota bacterium]